MRKLASFAAPFAAAALLCAYGAVELGPWLGAFCALLVLPCLRLPRGRTRTRGLLLVLGAAAGFLWCSLWTMIFLAPAEGLAGTTATATATVLDYPAETASGVSLDVELEGGVAARLYIRGGYAAAPGDMLTFTAEFERASLLYGEESTYYTARGVFLLAYAGAEEVALHPAEGTPLRFLPRVWAAALKSSLDEVFSPELAALLRGMLLGDKSGLSAGTRALFDRAGLSHILVVSGLHMTILLRGVTLLLRRRQRWLAPVGIPLLVLFVLMVGCTPSAVRAAVMNSLLLIAPLLRRENDSPTALSAALMLLLIQNPYAAAGVSLQLSFASVAGILLVAEPLEERLRESMLRPHYRDRKKPRYKLLGFLCSSLSMTLGAMAFTVPIIALWFGTVSIVSPLSNLLCLWAVSLLFLGGLIAGLLGLISPMLALPIALPTALLGRYVLWVAEGLGALTFAAVSLDSPYYRLWLAVSYAIAWAAFLLRRRGLERPVLPLCAPVVLLCAAALFTRLSYTARPLAVTALDVGQGSATAFYSQGAAMLVDCGGNAAASAGEIAADHFQAMGEPTLDLLVLTHLDGDHFNGVEELFARMEVKLVALPGREDEYGRLARLEELAAAEGAELRFIDRTEELALGGCTVTIFPPLGSGGSNEESLFVFCSAGEFDVLVTGDAGFLEEAILVKYFDIPDIEALVAGHHGSSGSTSAELLEAADPDYVLISVGYNSYGHPHDATLARLEEAGAAVYRTDLQGSVTLSADGTGKLTISTTR